MPKYTFIICPGYMRSKSDGDTHYITYAKLCELYQVKKYDAKLINGGDPRSLFGVDQNDPNTLFLNPLYHGNYAELLDEEIRRRESNVEE